MLRSSESVRHILLHTVTYRYIPLQMLRSSESVRDVLRWFEAAKFIHIMAIDIADEMWEFDQKKKQAALAAADPKNDQEKAAAALQAVARGREARRAALDPAATMGLLAKLNYTEVKTKKKKAAGGKKQWRTGGEHRAADGEEHLGSGHSASCRY